MWLNVHVRFKCNALLSRVAASYTAEHPTMKIDWHSHVLTRDTPLDDDYRNTQNVRRFLRAECGERFVFDRAFMAWVKHTRPLTLGAIADEWLRRQP